jgi:hypothetical protein
METKIDPGIVELIRHCGGFQLLHHQGYVTHKLCSFYGDIVSYKEAIKIGKAKAKSLKAEFIDNT